VKELLEFCETERQKEIVLARAGSLTNKEAADKLGIGVRNVQFALARVKKNAAKRGFSPQHDMTHPVPDGFIAKGVSTLYDDEGNIKGQWVKSDALKEDKIDQIRKALDEFILKHDGKSPKIPSPRKSKKSDELAVINIGDAHFGMYSHADISGDNYDVNIAANRHKEVILRLLNNAPDCDDCVINQLGDYYHADTYLGTTTKGTPLDTDGRLEHVFLIGLQVMSFIVEEALKRFKRVTVRHCRGNHDSVISMGLKAQQQAYWRNNKRVTIEMSPAPVWVFEWGKTAFLVTHGDAPKPAKLAEYFAAKYPEIWGKSKHRYCFHGHIHSKQTSIETYGGAITESFAGLPPADAWHDSMGYVSGQSMCLLVLHKEKGEVRRTTERI